MLDEVVKRATQGVTGALPYNPVEYCILAAGTAIAWAYMIELDLTIFLSFKRRSGVYFWSLLISSWGCSLHALGFILKFLVGTSWLVELPFVEVGWVSMVTGQAFVLWSRLHLVVRNQRTLHYVLYLIIFDAIILHLPTIIFTYGSNSPNADFWTPKFNVMERIQLVGFCLQEFLISTIYIVSTVRMLKSIYHSMARSVMMQLILINCICIGMDIVLIGLEFTNEYVGEASIKPMIYAIKLKLEFTVLNQLMGLSKAGFTEGHGHNSRGLAPSAHSHELKNRTLQSYNDPEAGAPPKKANNWSTVKGLRGSTVNQRNGNVQPEATDMIYRTQHIEVTSESGPDKAALTKYPVVSSTTLTAGSEPNSKVKSLMGTPIVYMPGRPGRNSQQDPVNRSSSPSESEKEIIRNSTDSETEKGTRSTGGVSTGGVSFARSEVGR
ncbi:hypothetical protein MMC06_002367 [Schaereria dolodes]|nr:hypothetical protein [Schaereria dolodes]